MNYNQDEDDDNRTSLKYEAGQLLLEQGYKPHHVTQILDNQVEAVFPDGNIRSRDACIHRILDDIEKTTEVLQKKTKLLKLLTQLQKFENQKLEREV